MEAKEKAPAQQEKETPEERQETVEGHAGADGGDADTEPAAQAEASTVTEREEEIGGGAEKAEPESIPIWGSDTASSGHFDPNEWD